MPQRFLRPGITNSERWNSVSWEAQSLYIRILTIVDDYGRCDGRIPVLWGHLYAVWNSLNPDNQQGIAAIRSNLQQLADKKMIEIYEADDKKVIQVTQWQERIRQGCVSKWPEKQRNLQQSAATCSNLLPPSPPSSPPPSSLRMPQGSGSNRKEVPTQDGFLLEVPPKPPPPEAPPDSPYSKLRSMWRNAYKSKFGFDYVHNGAKDGKAEKKLLSCNTPEEIMAVASQAWDLVNEKGAFYCKHASSVCGLASSWNAIRSEIGAMTKARRVF